MTIQKEKNFWLAAFLIFLIDQTSKLWALNFLPLYDEIEMNKHISLSLNYNEATIMLIHENPFGMSNAMFTCIWLSICCLITLGIWWVIRQPSLNNKGWTEEFAKTGLFFILGAAWGNGFDKIFRQGVVDFIQINTFKETTVPILNVADVMVYMGELAVIIAWIMIVYNLIQKKKKPESLDLQIANVTNAPNMKVNINNSEQI